ncbi:MAG: redoxin domain-containing protein [Acidobacteria bacterium]|nr:redoxin domain-containing protein [Acidobacteriota bacterium]
MPADILPQRPDYRNYLFDYLMRFHKLLMAVLAILLLSPTFKAMSQPGVDAPGFAKAAEFELKDQYDKSSAYRFPKQKLTVLTFGDRKGSEQIEGWVKPLWDRYQDKIDQKGVAMLSSVPSFARGLVRRIFKSQVKYSVLLDWSGDVSKSYGCKGGVANLFVIDRDGRIVMKLTGPATQSELAKVFNQLDKMLQ